MLQDAVLQRIGTDTDIKGEPLTGPNYRVALLMDYDWSIGNAGSLLFHIDYSHTDRNHFNQSDPDYFIDYKSRNSSPDLVDARITWKLPGDHWQLALWGENLLDHNYVADGVNIISTNIFGTPYVRRAPPRLWERKQSTASDGNPGGNRALRQPMLDRSIDMWRRAARRSI